ncbi:hypothetical protein Y032_0329g2669 [Ancylostoma ceylanicum]|uniref:Endonuclease/exonuclease/phosphatase domain-containing protein n=1 Tax=Ancylostoma ceylanicum TaxID=53326 RepID=A0A016RZK1_9BILA|nr:hypothetical protein Y032_0329g2669 [Ancylostoma ceylanicum]
MSATGLSDGPAEEHPTSDQMVYDVKWIQEEGYGVHGNRCALAGPGECGKYARVLDASRTAASWGKQAGYELNVAKTRIATSNVGTLTGLLHELAAALQRRRIDLCAVQETRWSGSKSTNIGSGFRIVYNGRSGTRSDVGVIVLERFRDSISGVNRFDDRFMKIVIVTLERRKHFFSEYAPQTGCTDQTKNEFWTLIDEKTAAVPQNTRSSLRIT